MSGEQLARGENSCAAQLLEAVSLSAGPPTAAPRHSRLSRRRSGAGAGVQSRRASRRHGASRRSARSALNRRPAGCRCVQSGAGRARAAGHPTAMFSRFLGSEWAKVAARAVKKLLVRGAAVAVGGQGGSGALRARAANARMGSQLPPAGARRAARGRAARAPAPLCWHCWAAQACPPACLPPALARCPL